MPLSSLGPAVCQWNPHGATIWGHVRKIARAALVTRQVVLSTSIMMSSPLIASAPQDAAASNYPNLPVISMRATALEVCYSVYGENATSIDAVDRFYESNASKFTDSFHARGHF